VIQKLAILCNESVGRIDAIRDYALALARAVRDRGVETDVCLRGVDGGWSVSGRDAGNERPLSNHECLTSTEYDALVLQYNPFMYGKWGFAPWLPLRMLALRRARVRTRIALMVHEPYVPIVSWQWALMGAWQRAQLEAVRVSADVVFASIEMWTRMLAERRPFRPAVHLPVGSNLPDRRDARAEMRRRLELGADDVALAALSTSTSGRLLAYVVRAANAAAANSSNVALLHLGAGAPELDGLSGSVRLCRPGRLSDAELASWLSAADLFLAPFVDGVSTRRTSLMAALQHALPIVGTEGSHTDNVLSVARDALRLVPVASAERFVEATVQIVESRDEARNLARAARALYESQFDWPVVAQQLLRALEPAPGR
jgi:glycosyltransferase involved in cell wall biosynthesis